MNHMIGKKIADRYEITEVVGGGGMSEVYRARDTSIGRDVAVKIMRAQYASDRNFVRRFRKEAQAVGSLSHPNIVSVFDVGEQDGIHYIVMEYVAGETLKDRIERMGRLSPEEAIDIGAQICDALEHAHENGVIHRDIKPHNILITEKRKVKVADFGIARAVSTITVTNSKGIMGSVHYFSPEQAEGKRTDHKSDIYSLGIVLYEMLTGELPFVGETTVGIALSHINDMPASMVELNKEVTPELEEVVFTAMSKEPEMRFASAADFRNALYFGLPRSHKKKVRKLKSETGLFSGAGIMRRKAKSQDTISFSPVEKAGGRNQEITGKKAPLLPIIAALLVAAVFLLPGMFFKEDVTVPSVTGLSKVEAERILRENGLSLTVAGEVNSNIHEEGIIIGQSPEKGMVTKEGKKVSVTVSIGPRKVSVPNLIGSSMLIADVNTTNAGLVLGDVSEVYSAEVPAGRVIRQDPEPGAQVSRGTEVDVVISKGSEPTFVSAPSLVGSDLETATSLLEGKGLKVGNIIRQQSDSYYSGQVIQQNPLAGASIFQGTGVDLVVSDGPGPDVLIKNISFSVKENGTVRIEVRDEQGTKTVYSAEHLQGDVVSREISYVGKGIITVYLDERKIREDVVSG